MIKKHLSKLLTDEAKSLNASSIYDRLSIANYAYLEEYSKKELICKLYFLSKVSRRDGYAYLADKYLDADNLWIVNQIASCINTQDAKNMLEATKPKYLDDMRKKLEFITNGNFVQINLCTAKNTGETQNKNFATIEAYSLKDLEQKRDFYASVAADGLINIEKYLYNEKNSLLHDILDHVLCGCDDESVLEYSKLEAVYRLRRLEELFDILYIGFVGIFNGDAPYFLLKRMLCFVEEPLRKDVVDSCDSISMT